MGKAHRLREMKATEKPTILGTISINLLSDGNVNVSGPLQDPATVGNAFGKAIHALILWHTQQAKGENDKRILMPGQGLMLPH